MHTKLLILSALFSNTALANISNVKIVDDIVYFTYLNQTSAACVEAGNSNVWAFSLNAQNGPDLYRALLHAQSSSSKVTVESTLTCSDKAGYETPRAISVSYN
ncbi:hypothetical protein [Pseudoalteromonas aurantia]|uniref:Uncharacterized protein n=1 Tax=Pseudoalteromonas aurantia 208 TaxID=1314867 RepID=A0ABR9EBU7_9GAMM|nr:hypothetical protein [Pseudoalteromonas aurantia]MBE0368302.1 hypothetical protein [Pseudoalteromonas aurantia 208]